MSILAQDIGWERAQPGIGAQLSEDVKAVHTIHTPRFGVGGKYISFNQEGDVTDPDDGEPRLGGLWIQPNGYDVTLDDPHEGNDPGPWRENPDHRDRLGSPHEYHVPGGCPVVAIFTRRLRPSHCS